MLHIEIIAYSFSAPKNLWRVGGRLSGILFTTIDRNLNPPSLLTASRKGEANVLISFFFRSVYNLESANERFTNALDALPIFWIDLAEL